MVTLLIISSILIIISAICRAISDTISHHYDESIFNKNKWFNTAISWNNKYKNGNKSEGSKFFGSTTIFVMFTDAWHFFEFLFRVNLIFGFFFIGLIPLKLNYLLILPAYLLWALIFHIFYSYIFIKKK